MEKDIAEYIKKEFDKNHGPTWHCIVGRNFESQTKVIIDQTISIFTHTPTGYGRATCRQPTTPSPSPLSDEVSDGPSGRS
ncbi:hypothetical protein ABZP36_025109 [Zizania latifolia]